MKLNPHSKYLRFIFFFLLILWGIIGIFDFANLYFNWNKPLALNQIDTRMNSLNLLGPELPQKTKDEVRILALGDSVTLGMGIFFKEDWPSQMEKKLRRIGVAATVMNAGKIGYLNKEIFESYQSLVDKGEIPNIVIYYGCGNIIGLYDISEPIYENIETTLNSIFIDFPFGLDLQEKYNTNKAIKKDNVIILPQLIKSQSYSSSFFGFLVNFTSKIQKAKKYFDEKEITSKDLPTNLENEIIYLSRIIKLAKKTNTTIVIVKPFYLFKYPKFTEAFWKFFYRFHYSYSDLPKIRQKIAEMDLFLEKFMNLAVVLDPTKEILPHIHPNSDFEDAKKIMAGDYVHFSKFGNELVGNYIGENLLSLGLVKRISSSEWVHPNEIVKDEAYGEKRKSQYLKYRDLSIDYKTHKTYLSCLSIVLICILFVHASSGVFSLLPMIITVGLFSYLSHKQYVEDLDLPLRILAVILFSFSFYKYFSSKFSTKRSLYILGFFVFISTLLFVNVNVFSMKFAKLTNSSDIGSMLKENIAWSEYIQFFNRKMAIHTFELEDIREDMYKFRIPIPFSLISNLRNNLLPLLFAPVIPALFSSVFKFDSVEIFFLLASLPYIVLYLMYIKILNKIIISKMKYLLYPIGLIFIKQEIDFLFPIVFLIVSLTSLGIYSIYSPVKKYPVTWYLSALAFWPLYYLVIPETLVLLGLVCVYFFLMELYRNSFNLWSSIRNTFLWICVLFIPKLFILMLPNSKVNLDYMIQYNLLPKTFNLLSVYSFLATLLLLLFLHANIEKIKSYKRKILQVGRNAF